LGELEISKDIPKSTDLNSSSSDYFQAVPICSVFALFLSIIISGFLPVPI
jgi:hypothetical protein